MRFMAVDALRNATVLIGMTEVAGEGRMLARTGKHLLLGTSVTGDTNLLVFTFEANIQWLMRIMAPGTIL